MAVDTPYDFHLRNKHELYRSLCDGLELENAAANYLFSKSNAIRHNVFQQSSEEQALNYAADSILKRARGEKYRDEYHRKQTSEQFGLSDEDWIPRLAQFTDGHKDPRHSHSSWPTMGDVDPTIAYGGISPWDLSVLTANSEWGSPEWLRALSDVWEPQGNDDDPEHHYNWIENQIKEHEGHHALGFHNKDHYLGPIEGDAPSDLYEKHFARWKAEAAPPEVLDMSLGDQKQAHLDLYKRVWAGAKNPITGEQERDPLADISDTGSHQLGFLGYGLGLEWLTPSQRDDVINHINQNGVTREIPHVSHGWMNRNWMGRFLAGEATQRLRDPSHAGSSLTATHHGFETDDQKEHHNARRLHDAMLDTLVYSKDNPVLGVDAGDPVHGYWAEDEQGDTRWVHSHDTDSGAAPAYRLRGMDDADFDSRLMSDQQMRRIGAVSLQDHILSKPENRVKRSVKVSGKTTPQNVEFGVMPRLLRLEEGGHDNVHRGNFAFKSTEKSTNEALEEHHNKPIWDLELQHWLDTGVIDENQATAMKARRKELHEHYNRRRQVQNGTGAYLNMYHFMGGDENDIRMSPFARFIMMHHAQGGGGMDSMNMFSELNHMFHHDVWGNPDGGLFTVGDAVTSGWEPMKLEEGQSPLDFPENIWPRARGMEGDDREAAGYREGSSFKGKGITLRRNQIRDGMASLIGALQDQPIDTWRDAGTSPLLNLAHGGNTDIHQQLMITADPHFHEMLRDGMKGLKIGELNPYKDARGGGDDNSLYNETRYSLHHASDKKGKSGMKNLALLAALWGRWNENPAEAQLASGPSPFLETGKMTQKVEGQDLLPKKLMALARREGMHLIPGHPGDTDLQSRVKQFLLHSDLMRQLADETPLALESPASDVYESDRGVPTLSAQFPGGGPAPEGITPTSWGPHPGEEESDPDIGWLNPNIPRGKWFFHNKDKDVSHNTYLPLEVNIGGGKTQMITPTFDFKDHAHQALDNGEMDCPVCGGDGYIDPEDMGAEIPDARQMIKGIMDLIGDAADDNIPERTECPNCHGAKKMQLPSTFNRDSTHVQPHHIEHKERELTQQLEDWLATPPEERDPEKGDAWFDEIERQLTNLPTLQPLHSDQQYSRMSRFGSKFLSTQNLVRNVATSLADKVRAQFESDGLGDPFGPDENGDWSQAHVNAIALWSHANEWALRAQPHQRDWQNDQISGYTGQEPEQGEKWQDTFKEHDDQFMPSAGSAIHYPGFSSDGGNIQNEPMSLPLSIYNSMGHRMRHGWGMTPTYGISFDNMGTPTVLHNEGKASTQRNKYLNVPLDELQQVFPEMQTMSSAHPSAPSAEDRPESQKLNDMGDSMAFRMSEDEPAVSDILKALTNPDLLKEDARVKPVKAAHRIFDLDDLKQLRGFSDDWVVSTWIKGHRGIARKEGDKVSVQYADGSYCPLTEDAKKGLREAHDDDFVMDVIVGKNKRITVIDLLEHDGRELYEEPLKDRLTKLRSNFESTDDVHMPAPFNTRRTDDEGLSTAISSLADEENDGFLLRDAISTYMKGEPRHPKWVLLRKQKEVDVIILDRRGRGPYTYQLGIGPINPEKGESLGNRAVQRGDKWFMDVGTITRESKAFNEGDYVQVSVSSVSHKERDGEDVYDLQTRSIIGETSTEATDSVDTLCLLTKSYAPLIWPHDVVVNRSDVQVLLHGLNDTVIYKMNKWDNGWALHQPISLLGDLSNSDYSIHLSESLRPFWEPIVGMTLKGLIKVDYNPRDTKDKTRDEKEEEEEEHSHESGFKLPKPKRMDEEQILKPEMTKMVVQALTLIDDVISKEKATWTGARGMGIGLGTPDSAPRGPTEITQDVNTLDYDMRQRDDEKTEKPRKKPKKMQGEPHPMTASVTTDEGEKGKIRVTNEEAALEMEPENPFE